MDSILQCRALTKRYGSFTALDAIDLTLPKGKIIGLLGPNGSGKTTLIKMIAGILKPTGGQLLVGEREIGLESKKIVSYLPERTYLPDWMNMHQVICLFKDFYEDFFEETAYEMLKQLDIDPSKRIKSMSKGTKEKVQLILVMSRKAGLYLLDEPIGGVDPAARDFILRTIISNYNENATVVISTHLIADVESVLDEIVFLSYGKIIMQGSVDSIREEKGKSINDIFREVFAC